MAAGSAMVLDILANLDTADSAMDLEVDSDTAWATVASGISATV